MPKYLLGVDFGGSASKATLLRDDGRVVATAVGEYPTYRPSNGWTEQDPKEQMEAFVGNVHKILSCGVEADDIVAMAISAASQTAVYLDKNDRPVRNSIHWTDGRAGEYVRQIREKFGQKIYQKCHNTPSTARTIAHLSWIRDNEPENFNRIERIMFVKDYIRYSITGDFVTDYIDAMGSMLMDVPNNCWDEELCGFAGVRPEQLPRIADPRDFVGDIKQEMLKLTGLSKKTKVIVGSTDTAMEVYANGAIHQGQMTVKLATAGRICPITDHELNDPMLINYKHVVPGLWYPGTGTKSCAASYEWYRDVMCVYEQTEAKKAGVKAYDIMNQEAANIAACSDNLFFHPYLQGELTPYFDQNLRGSFTGIASFHTKAHFTRAVMEGVAFSLLDCYKVLEKQKLNIAQTIIIGGGAESALWRQIVCDMLGIEMIKTENADSSLGSAMLAGVASGIFKDFDDSTERCVCIQEHIKPNEKNHKLYAEGYKKYRCIHDALETVYGSWQEQ